MEKKIKVVIGINDFLVGGAQKLIIDQLHLFDKRKYEFYLITLFQFPKKDEFYDEIPAHIHVCKLAFGGFASISSWFRLAGILRQVRPDVVVSNLFFSNTVFRVLKLLLGYRVITVEHNTYTFKTGPQKLLDKLLSFFTQRIVAVSKTVADFTAKQEHIDPKKFIVIHNGIRFAKIEEFRKAFTAHDVARVKKEIGVDADDKIIINTARLLGQKNHVLLVEAFFEFRKTHKEYKLIILGEGSARKMIEENISKYGLGGSVFLLGTRRDVLPYYCVSEFFVLTSKIEGFGIACIEAFACGIPVISTRVAGPDEFVEDGRNGFLVESDSKDIAKKMEMVAALSSDKKSAWRENCIRTAQRFDIRENVRKYEELLDECD